MQNDRQIRKSHDSHGLTFYTSSDQECHAAYNLIRIEGRMSSFKTAVEREPKTTDIVPADASARGRNARRGARIRNRRPVHRGSFTSDACGFPFSSYDTIQMRAHPQTIMIMIANNPPSRPRSWSLDTARDVMSSTKWVNGGMTDLSAHQHPSSEIRRRAATSFAFLAASLQIVHQ